MIRSVTKRGEEFMKWKKIIRFSIIIICTFLLLTIECKTMIMAAVCQNNDRLSVPVNYAKKALTTQLINDKINQTIKRYYGDYDAGKMISNNYSTTRFLSETDEAFLTHVLKIYPIEKGTYVIGIPNEASINKISLDADEDTVIIEMTQGYQIMNYGAFAEELALKSLAYTVAHFYNVHYVIIKVQGEPYTSGHFYFQNNEKIQISE